MGAKSKLSMLDDYVVIDIETTGYYVGADEIIELGAVRIRNNQPVQEFQTFINMDYVPEEITKLTGITLNDLRSGLELRTAINLFDEFVGDDPVIGHNLAFDLGFLSFSGSKLNTTDSHWVDTLRLCRRLLPSDSGHSLSTVSSILEIIRPKEHRSVEDCHTANAVYQHLKQTVIDNGKTFEDYFKRKSGRWYSDLKNIEPTTEDFDENHVLFGKIVVFTGNLNNMSRKEAAQRVVNIGGKCANGVNRKTNYVVIGYYDPHQGVIGKSNKTKRAEELIADGYPIEILLQDEFLELIEE